MGHMGYVRTIYMPNDREGIFRSVNHIVKLVVNTCTINKLEYN